MVGRRPDEDLARGCVLFEARCRIHGVAGHQTLSTRDVTGHYLAGVDARPVLQTHAVVRLEQLIHFDEPSPHLERRSDGSQRVVLMHPWQTEDRHDRVADVLLDASAVALEDAAHLVEVEVEHLPKVLAIEPLTEGRGPFQVREDDRDRPTYLFHGHLLCERGATESAQSEPIRVLLAAVGADLHAASVGRLPRVGDRHSHRLTSVDREGLDRPP